MADVASELREALEAVTIAGPEELRALYAEDPHGAEQLLRDTQEKLVEIRRPCGTCERSTRTAGATDSNSG